jgi:DNA-binding CsgD family transcriptional regulator
VALAGYGGVTQGEETIMATSGLLRECDLHALMAVIEDGRRDDPGAGGMPWAVLEGLMALIPCDIAGFCELDRHAHKIVIQQDLEQPAGKDLWWNDAGDEKFWTHFPTFRPQLYQQRTGDLTSVLRWSDFYTTSELHNAPAYAEYFGRHGWKHSMIVELPTPSCDDRRLLFWRSSGADFNERDKLILQLLRPHLIDVYLDAGRRRRGIPHLSRREREVLQLAAQGHSNADIARILFITLATVRKHMEHIFDRTGVRTRAAAAALALPHPTPTGTDHHYLHLPPTKPETGER